MTLVLAAAAFGAVQNAKPEDPPEEGKKIYADLARAMIEDVRKAVLVGNKANDTNETPTAAALTE